MRKPSVGPGHPIAHGAAQPQARGVRPGRVAPVLPRGELPAITVPRVVRALDGIACKQGCYAHVLYLARCRPNDVFVLLEASQDADVKVRWQRLWILAPTLARLARSQEGSGRVVEGLDGDLLGAYLLAKMHSGKPSAIKRLFDRTHDPLLVSMLKRLWEFRTETQRLGLLVEVIAALETRESVLSEVTPRVLGAEAAALVWPWLRVEPDAPSQFCSEKLGQHLRLLAAEKAENTL